MSSVLERLQALVTTAVSQTDGQAAAKAEAATAAVTADTTSGQLAGDTLRPAAPGYGKQRRRRQTDATVSSVSTAVSAESGSATGAAASPGLSPSPGAAGSSKQETERLLTYRMGDLERVSRLHPVSKVLQQEAWDCGLACVCMLLRASGQPTCSVAQLARQVRTASVWTVDLAFLIRHNLPHADFTYYTACAGVNPDHSRNRFYDDMVDGDERRVERLFAKARAGLSVRIVEITIPLLDLKRFLVHRKYVAVLLVDGAQLRCFSCERARSSSAPAASRHGRAGATHARSRSMNIFSTRPADASAPKEASGFLSWFSRRRRARDSGYLGHYILLFAYIPSLDVFLYRDPAIPEEFCLASADTIDAARTCPGTDADCIIVKL